MANVEMLFKRCDGCLRAIRFEEDRQLVWFTSHSDADREARKQGWYVDAQRDLCPDCRAEYETTEEEDDTE